jgi:hypothetical protein
MQHLKVQSNVLPAQGLVITNQECNVDTFKAADTTQQDGQKLTAKYNV